MSAATNDESSQQGRAARTATPRSSHAVWRPAPNRQNPVAILEAQARTRVPELVPIRYGRMLSSPFGFFRGGAAIMAADLAATPATGLRAQLCGDAHLANFGGFAAPDRRLVFDVNDFDETLPGPWEWDIKRLAASVAVLGRDRGLDAGVREDTIEAAVREYRDAMRRFAAMRTVDVWYARADVANLFERWSRRLSAKGRKRLDRTLTTGGRKDSLRALAKLTRVVDGEPRFVSEPPLLVPIEELLPASDPQGSEERLRKVLDAYRGSLQDDRRHLVDGYRPVHLARKVVGVGSVGTWTWVFLMLGHDATDPLVLQIKEAEGSVLERFAGATTYGSQGERVVAGQRLMQSASDVFLGWTRGEDRRDYYVRQLWDAKGSVDINAVPVRDLTAYTRLCGWTLARAPARSGDRLAIAAYLGGGDNFDRAIVTFAEAYADQNQQDYDSLRAAVDSGAVAAEAG
jgi:uncharacterized protein (DUF2252 family)